MSVLANCIHDKKHFHLRNIIGILLIITRLFDDRHDFAHFISKKLKLMFRIFAFNSVVRSFAENHLKLSCSKSIKTCTGNGVNI